MQMAFNEIPQIVFK